MNERKRGTWQVAALAAVAALVAMAVWWGYQEASPAGLPEGMVAPELTLSLDDGRAFDLAQARGQIVVLNFWATWCYACKTEAGALSAVHGRLRERGEGEVLGISTDAGSLADTVETARRWGMAYPITHAAQPVIDRFAVRVLPTTYVIDPTGRIRFAHVGGVTESALERAIAHARAAGTD